MQPDEEERASLVDMLGFAREVVTFIQGRKRTDLDRDRALLRSLERALELEEIWKTAERDAPPLVSALEAIVATLPPPR